MPIKVELPELTQENYYENWTDWKYLSPTWFKKFKKNEAEAMAELKGEWNPYEDNTALLVGNYLHSYFESREAHETFIKEHESEIISSRGASKGQLKKDYLVADDMINRLEAEPLFTSTYQGEKEVIVTGIIGGVNFKGKLDLLHIANPDDPEDANYFMDLKTTKSIQEGVWSDEHHARASFVEAYNYALQMAVYQELLRQKYGAEFTPFIWAVSKQDEPDIMPIYFAPSRLNEALADVESNAQHVMDVIRGEVEPKLVNDGSKYWRAHHAVDDFVEVGDILSFGKEV